jgi:uncharacterized protein YybS (DUF2232 family)
LTPLNHRDATRDASFGIGIVLALFAGILFAFLLPLPALMFRLKFGRSKGAVAVAIVLAALAILTGGAPPALLSLLALLMMGYVLGDSFEKGFPLEKAVIVSCGAQAAVGVLALLFYSHSAGIGIGEMLSGYTDGTIAFYKSTIDQVGGAVETRQAFHDYIDWFGPAVLRPGIIGIVVSGILFTAWVNLLLAKLTLGKMGLTFPDFGSLNRWRSPEKLIWVLIGSGLLLLMPGEGPRAVGLSGLLVMLQVYFFQGIAIVSFFFEKARFPLWARGILYFFILQALPLVIGLGIFDMWLNVRKIKSNPDD